MIGYIVFYATAATMISSAIFGWLTLTRMKSDKREYIVLATFCIVVGELGYIMEMMATDADGGMTAMRVMYFGLGLASPMFMIFVQSLFNIFSLTKRQKLT